MDTGNVNQSNASGKDTSYRQEDLAVFETLNKMNRKLRTFKIMTPIIGALLVVVGVWGVMNSSGGNENPDQTRVNALNQQLDSLKEANKTLKSEQQSLESKVDQKKTIIDSLREKRKAKASDEGNSDQMNGGTEEAEARTYEVDTNDNLWKIAKKFYDDGHQSDKIIEANNLDSPDLLKVDQKLTIPK